MNERIKELANQMFSMEQFEYAEEFINDEFLEKFAELIVQECILVARKAENEDEIYAWFAISNHFGVES